MTTVTIAVGIGGAVPVLVGIRMAMSFLVGVRRAEPVLVLVTGGWNRRVLSLMKEKLKTLVKIKGICTDKGRVVP
jgi:hypothetical protein